MDCRVCGNGAGNRRVQAREMMYGLGESFGYVECAQCGCLSLEEVPQDLSPYYPGDYYSLTKVPDAGPKRLLKRIRARHALGHRSPLGAFLCRAWGIPPFVEWFQPVHPSFDAAILDVGSGDGDMLRQMAHAGFTNLTGIDPFLPVDTQLAPGASVLRRRLEEMSGTYDYIMFNHSFEHLGNPGETLAKARELLSADGHLVVRMPVVGKAWRQYGANWVQLDAPRHIIVHSVDSFRRLAEGNGFEITEVRYDSTGFQFWGSEQYERGIPLLHETSFAVAPEKASFTKREIESFEAQARSLNASKDGDQATFYLRPRVEP